MTDNYTYEDYEISARALEDIKAYISHGRKVGHFLTAIISNDLSMAVLNADSVNKRNIPAFVAYFQWEAPERCHGSHAKFGRWVDLKGSEGIVKAEAKEKAKAEAENNQPDPDEPPPKRYA